MHTPAQEAVAQLMFWSGIGSLPASISFFAAGFKVRSRTKRLICLTVGGILLTHFLWYFSVLGISLATKVGHPVYPPWWYFTPIGFGLAFLLAKFNASRTVRETSKT